MSQDDFSTLSGFADTLKLETPVKLSKESDSSERYSLIRDEATPTASILGASDSSRLRGVPEAFSSIHSETSNPSSASGGRSSMKEKNSSIERGWQANRGRGKENVNTEAPSEESRGARVRMGTYALPSTGANTQHRKHSTPSTDFVPVSKCFPSRREQEKHAAHVGESKFIHIETIS